MTHKLTDNQGRPKLDQAIERALNLIEKQNKRIEELKADSVPKSVIREKMESLKEQLKNVKDEAYDICEIKIWALEDLLDIE